jgi:hypothetical protein
LNRFCANEADYHQRIINHMEGFPDALKSRSGLAVFVWGHEVELHHGGRNSGNGSADLFTVDEDGMVWLIEVKFKYTSEKGQFVWSNQLRRYKRAINNMEWQEVLRYTAKFLRGKEKTKPAIRIPASVTTFTQVLQIWQQNLKRELTDANELKDRVATRLKGGTYGIMVLTDFYDASYEKFGQEFDHEGPLAYVQGVPTAEGMNYAIQWYRPATGDASPQLNSVNWTSELEAPQWRCSPETFPDGLCHGARQLWCDVLKPGLDELGATYKFKNAMSFEVEFDVNGTRSSLLRIGWSERPEEKKAGKAPIKINPRVKNIYKVSNDEGLANKWIKRFHALGWRGRPSNSPRFADVRGDRRERWGVVPVTKEELDSENEGIMQYNPDHDIWEHNGRPGDRESLEGLLCDYSELLKELRKKRDYTAEKYLYAPSKQSEDIGDRTARALAPATQPAVDRDLAAYLKAWRGDEDTTRSPTAWLRRSKRPTIVAGVLLALSLLMGLVLMWPKSNAQTVKSAKSAPAPVMKTETPPPSSSVAHHR